VRDIYVPTKVQADVDRLEMIYQRMGLLNASIVADVKNKNQNRIDLTFKIKEGQKKYIEDIFFEGNNAFSASTLREQMMSRTHRWYHIFASTDTYDPDRLNYDKDLLRRYYYQKGYIDFEMELPSTKTELFTDEEFKEQVGEMGGDVVKKSVEKIWETQNELALIEEKVGKMLDDKNVKRKSDKLLVEQFMEKGFLLKTETDDNGEKHFVAIDVKQNKSYNLELDSDFDIVRKSVFSDIIVN
jgi:outer membrane protein assembly factor BamA